MDDFELIKGCIEGNSVVKEAFVKKYLPIIYGSIRNATRSHFVKFNKSLSFI